MKRFQKSSNSQQHHIPELGIMVLTLHLLWRELITGDEFIEVACLPFYLPWDDLCRTSADKPNEESEPYTHIYVDNFKTHNCGYI